MQWLMEDGHPGRDLTLLMAIELYRSIYHEWPQGAALVVRGPMHAPKEHFDLRKPVPSSSGATAVDGFVYGAAEVLRVIEIEQAAATG